MSGYLSCKTCSGRGLGPDRKECPECDGYGILVVEREFTLLKGGNMETETKEKAGFLVDLGEIKVVELRSSRLVQTVREETLALWKSELDLQVEDLKAQLRKIYGGIAQIEEELERRVAANKKRSATP